MMQKLDMSSPAYLNELENVVYFGDPDLRLYVPGTEFSDTNNWEKPESLRYDKDLSINQKSHLFFGSATAVRSCFPKPCSSLVCSRLVCRQLYAVYIFD